MVWKQTQNTYKACLYSVHCWLLKFVVEVTAVVVVVVFLSIHAWTVVWKGDTLCSPEKEAVIETVPTLLLFFRSPSSPFLLLDLNSFLSCPQSTHNYILFWLMFSLQKSRRFHSQLIADKLSAQHQTLETFGSMCSNWSLLTERGLEIIAHLAMMSNAHLSKREKDLALCPHRFLSKELGLFF